MNLKRIFTLSLLIPLFCFAQTAFYNTGSSIYIQQAGLIHVNGGILNTNNDSIATIQNDGIIELTGDFENDSGASFSVYNNSNSTDRAVKFVGSGTESIKGNMATTNSGFYNLVIDKVNPSDTVAMQTSVNVQGSLVFGSANTTTTYNPSSLYTNNNQLGLFKTFDDTLGEFLLNIQDGNADAIAGYPVLQMAQGPTTGFILTSGYRTSNFGGVQRKISSATSYVFPVGTRDKGFQGVSLNFSQVPGTGSVKVKFCSGSSNPTGYVGQISTFCSGCPEGQSPSTPGYNRYFTSNACNGGAPQWLILNNTEQNFGYWSMAATDTGYTYDIEAFPNGIEALDITQMYRILKYEAPYGADPSLASVDWMSSIDSTVSNLNDLLTYTLNGGCYGGNGIPGGIYKDFCQFTPGNGGSGEALPVTLLYVQAEAMGKHCINVTWATAVEINNHGFEVMRSTDGVNFTDVGWVEGHDNSTVQNNYSFMDRVPQNTTYYYKLKQEDNNGNFVYSNIVQATLANEAESDFALYPNPTSNQLFINVSNPANEVDVRIYDMAGQEVFQNIFTVEQNGIAQVYSINVAAILHVGTYIVTAKTNGTQFSSKFVLQ